MIGHNSCVTCEELAFATNQFAYVIKEIDRSAGPSEDQSHYTE